MRVLHMANSYFFINRLLMGKLRGLADSGVRIETASPAPEGSTPLPFPAHDFPVPRAINPAGDVRAFYSALTIIRRGNYDIVHTHSAKAGFIGRMAAYFLDVPCVHSAHGLPFYDGQRHPSKEFYRALEHFAGKRCDCVLAQNHEDCETLKNILPGGSVFYEGNGLDLKAVSAHASGRAKARESMGLKETDVAVAMFARLEPVKRQDVFIDAFDLSAAENPDLVAVFAGNDMGLGGEFSKRVLDKVNHSPNRDRIRLLGFLDEPLSALCGCDIVAITSEKEGLPRIVMEGMALGLPVCATNAPGTRELVLGGVSGFLSPVNDYRAFSKNLSALTKDADLRKSMGSAAMRFAEAELDESRVISRILRAYDYVLTERS